MIRQELKINSSFLKKWEDYEIKQICIHRTFMPPCSSIEHCKRNAGQRPQAPGLFRHNFYRGNYFLCRLIPGIIVATLFNPVMTLLRCAMTGSEIFLYDFLYGICGILIVIASWLFSRNKKEFHFNRRVTLLYLLIIVFFSTFVSSFSASALDTFIRPLFEKASGFSAIDDISLVFQKMNFSVFLSYLLPRIPITLLDRCICTFAAYGIYSGLRK